jgi:hypothetical protein
VTAAKHFSWSYEKPERNFKRDLDFGLSVLAQASQAKVQEKSFALWPGLPENIFCGPSLRQAKPK